MFVIAIEESLGSLFVEELKDFGLNAISVNTLEKAISILDYQQFDLVLLYPALWDEKGLKEILDKIKPESCVKTTYRKLNSGRF